MRATVHRTLLACLLGFALPGHAASPADVVHTILTPAYLQQDRCASLGDVLLRPPLLAALPQKLTRAQLRDLATRYDLIHARLCASAAPAIPAESWVRVYEKHAPAAPPDWLFERFLADPLAVKWAGIAARLRTELVSLGRIIDLELAIDPRAFNPDATVPAHDLRSPAMRKLMEEILLVSLTREEAKTRFLLATLHAQPTFREMLPARFDIERLARIEAKTRELGLPFIHGYHLRLEPAFDARTRTLMFTDEQAQPGARLDGAIRAATAQVKALAGRYRRP